MDTGKTVRVIYKCRCGTTYARDYTGTVTTLRVQTPTPRGFPVRFVTRTEVRNLHRVDENGRAVYPHADPCPNCGHHAKGRAVQGTHSDHECNSKCLASKGHLCDCSCGGANHGKNYL